MSEYYIGAIRANSNYLAHYRTKGTKNGEGKYFRNGVPTAEGLKRYGKNAGYQVVGPSRQPVAITMNQRLLKRVPYKTPERTFTADDRAMNRQFEQRTGGDGLGLLPKKVRRDAPSDYKPMSDEEYRTLRNRNRFVGADRAMSWTGNKNLVSDVATGVENIGISVGNWGQQAIKDVGNWLAKAGDTVKQWLSPATNWIKEKWNVAKSWLNKQPLFKAAKRVVGKFADWGKTAVSSVVGSITKTISRAIGSIGKSANKAVGSAKEYVRRYGDYGKEYADYKPTKQARNKNDTYRGKYGASTRASTDDYGDVVIDNSKRKRRDAPYQYYQPDRRKKKGLTKAPGGSAVRQGVNRHERNK